MDRITNRLKLLAIHWAIVGEFQIVTIDMPKLPVIVCKPDGLFSWNFHLSGDQFQGKTEMGKIRESGAIWIGEAMYEVKKRGFLSSHWELLDDKRIIAVAQRESIFNRTFSIRTAAGLLTLEANESFGPSMSLSGPGFQATISTIHSGTRRSQMTGIWKNHEFMVFGFWLSALMWRKYSGGNPISGTRILPR